jgi:hypothetical protein
MKKSLFLGIILVLLFSLPVYAEPILNPNNGHYYERITGNNTWVDAKAAAESMSHMGASGHLATITSDEENWWIVVNLGGELTLDHWLGGYLEDGNWKWVTGEPWDYTNWWDGNGWTEPSGDGDALEFDDAEQSPPIPGYWNDLDKNSIEPGFIVEFDQFPPTAQCGADQVVFDEVTLDGSASFDLDGWIVSYNWKLQHRTNTAITIEATGENPTITGLDRGFYDVRLTVTDNYGATDFVDSLLAAAGSCSCPLSSIHVESIVADTTRGSRGQSFGQVTVLVNDNCGRPVSEVNVEGHFEGDFYDIVSDVTGADGTVVFNTSTEIKKPTYNFCVDSLVNALPYDPGDNVESCDGMN